MTEPRPKPRLQDLFGRPKPEPYTPIGRSLAAIGIPPRRMDVEVDGATVECLVIPVVDLMYREWMHMTGGGLRDTPPPADNNSAAAPLADTL